MANNKISNNDRDDILNLYKTKTIKQISEIYNGKYTFYQIKNIISRSNIRKRTRISDEVRDNIISMAKMGIGHAEISRTLNINFNTVAYIIHINNINTKDIRNKNLQNMIIDKYKKGYTTTKIANSLNISISSIYKLYREYIRKHMTNINDALSTGSITTVANKFGIPVSILKKELISVRKDMVKA